MSWWDDLGFAKLMNRVCILQMYLQGTISQNDSAPNDFLKLLSCTHFFSLFSPITTFIHLVVAACGCSISLTWTVSIFNELAPCLLLGLPQILSPCFCQIRFPKSLFHSPPRHSEDCIISRLLKYFANSNMLPRIVSSSDAFPLAGIRGICSFKHVHKQLSKP